MTDMTTPGFDTAALYFTDRLLDALADVERFPLTLIEAPMGYGKTLAVRHWLHGRTARQVWVSTLGASEDAFWRDFCVALARAFPDNEDVTDSLLRLGYPTDTVRLDAARELVLRLDFAPGTVLVVDDVHLLPVRAGCGMAGLCLLSAPPVPGGADFFEPNQQQVFRAALCGPGDLPEP